MTRLLSPLRWISRARKGPRWTTRQIAELSNLLRVLNVQSTGDVVSDLRAAQAQAKAINGVLRGIRAELDKAPKKGMYP